MRELTDAQRLVVFMRRLGMTATKEGRVYFTGGATAVLLGWRPTTIDVDLRLEGDAEELLRAIPGLKEELRINVELASPSDFIPELPGWRERSTFVAREGRLDFLHYDLYAQALAKIERGHTQDLADVRMMLDRGLVDPIKAREFYDRIEPDLYRYPALDPPSFRRKVDAALRGD